MLKRADFLGTHKILEWRSGRIIFVQTGACLNRMYVVFVSPNYGVHLPCPGSDALWQRVTRSVAVVTRRRDRRPLAICSLRINLVHNSQGSNIKRESVE